MTAGSFQWQFEALPEHDLYKSIHTTWTISQHTAHPAVREERQRSCERVGRGRERRRGGGTSGGSGGGRWCTILAPLPLSVVLAVTMQTPIGRLAVQLACQARLQAAQPAWRGHARGRGRCCKHLGCCKCAVDCTMPAFQAGRLCMACCGCWGCWPCAKPLQYRSQRDRNRHWTARQSARCRAWRPQGGPAAGALNKP